MNVQAPAPPLGRSLLFVFPAFVVAQLQACELYADTWEICAACIAPEASATFSSTLQTVTSLAASETLAGYMSCPKNSSVGSCMICQS